MKRDREWVRPRSLRTRFAVMRLAPSHRHRYSAGLRNGSDKPSPGHSLSSARLSARTPRACVIAISALHPGFRQGREGAHACLMPTGGLNLQNVGNGFRRVASRVAANTTAGAKRGDFQPITNLTRNSLPGFERLDTHRDWHPDYRLSIGDYESLAHG